MFDDKRVDGLCSPSSRTLWLDGALDENTIVSVLRHEHTHAWEAEVGRTRYSEDIANFVATVSEAFDYDFEEHGGKAALLLLSIEGTAPPEILRAPAESTLAVHDRVYCACGQVVMGGSIDIGSPFILPSTALHAVPCSFECPTCSAIQVWDERSTREGLPLGQYFNIKRLEGEEARVWRQQRNRGRTYFNVA